MAILIVEHNGNVEGASLAGRVLIGRRPSNHVVISDPAVSRIHAWVDAAGRVSFLTDAGSRTGTFVNGRRVSGAKVPLHHGDRITIGPASLTFRADGSLPAGVSQLDFADCDDAPAHVDGGILFACACGAPLWISSAFAGRQGKCRFCGAVVQVPPRPGLISSEDIVITAPAAAIDAAEMPPEAPAPIDAPLAHGLTSCSTPAPPAEAMFAPAEAPGAGATTHTTHATATCGACQSAIASDESATACPACGLTFHADCWTENLGCSAYGCSQVNALAPKGELAESTLVESVGSDLGVEFTSTGDADAEHAGADAHAAPKVTAEYALLAGSVLGVVAGALTFGVPALLALGAVAVYLKRQRRRTGRRASRVVLAAGLLALLGAAAGAAVSYVWWLDHAPAASYGSADRIVEP